MRALLTRRNFRRAAARHIAYMRQSRSPDAVRARAAERGVYAGSGGLTARRRAERGEKFCFHAAA